MVVDSVQKNQKKKKKNLASEAAFCACDHSTAPLVYCGHWPSRREGGVGDWSEMAQGMPVEESRVRRSGEALLGVGGWPDCLFVASQ